MEEKIISLLSSYGIRLRQPEGGKLKQVNLSIPDSVDGAFVIGLRYVKPDNTPTEDHYLCEKGAGQGEEIVPFPKKKLEYKLPEYEGAHKGPFDTSEKAEAPPTLVNTISLWIK